MRLSPPPSLGFRLRNLRAAVLLLGSLSLAFPFATQAQILFSIDEFTTDTLTITLQPGSLDTSNGGFQDNQILLVDGNGTNTTWVLTGKGLTSGGGSFGSASFTGAAVVNAGDGDFVYFGWDSNLSTAGDLVSGVSFTFTTSGLFDPDAVEQFALYWGDPLSPPATLQSVGSAMTGGGSAVPEPGTYALLAGLGGLGLALLRRRGVPASA